MKRLGIVITIGVILIAIMGLSIWYAYLKKNQAKPDFINSFQTYAPRDGAGSAGGGTDSNITSAPNGTITPTGNEPAMEIPKENISEPVAVSSDPVGGGAFSETEDGTATLFIDRAKGTIYEIDPTTNKATKISTMTIPGIVDFAVDSLGTTMMMKTSTTPDSQELILTTPSQKDQTQKIVLDTNVIDAVIGSTVYYIAKDSLTSGSTLYRADTHGDNKKALWHSHLTNWSLKLADKDTLTIQQKPSNNTPGYAYTFSIPTKKLTPLIGDLPGLSVLLSPKKHYIIYTAARGGTLVTKIKTLATGQEVTLKKATLIEKCAWASDDSFVVCGFPENLAEGVLPDAWYQGSVVLTDALERIDPSTGDSASIVQKKKTADLDVEKISISSDKKKMLLVDKKTGILWTLGL